MFRPGAAVPKLESIADSDHDDIFRERGMLAEKARDHHAPGGVEIGVMGAAVEEALELVQPR